MRHAGMAARLLLRFPNPDRDQNCYPLGYSPQFLSVALVSLTEIEQGDISLINDYLVNMFKNTDSENGFHRAEKFIQYDRLAVVINCSKDLLLVHGEARVFDPDRKLLSDLIPNKGTDTNIHTNQRKDPARKVLSNLQNNFRKKFGSLDQAVYLIFSYYVPCSIPFNECSKLLHLYVKSTSSMICVSFEAIHRGTDVKTAFLNMEHRNIAVFKQKQFLKELSKEERNYCLDDVESDIDFDDNLPEFPETYYECRKSRYRKRRKLKKKNYFECRKNKFY